MRFLWLSLLLFTGPLASAQSLDDQLNALLLYPNDLRYALLGDVADQTLSVTYVFREAELCSWSGLCTPRTLIWDDQSRLRRMDSGDPFNSGVRLQYHTDSIVRRETGREESQSVYDLEHGQIYRYRHNSWRGLRTCTVERDTVLAGELLRLRQACTLFPKEKDAAPIAYTQTQYVFLNAQQDIELVTLHTQEGHRPQFRFPPHVDEDLPIGCGEHVFLTYTVTAQHRLTFAQENRVSIPLKGVVPRQKGHKAGTLEVVRTGP